MRTLSSYEIENSLLEPDQYKVWWCPPDEDEGKPPEEFLGEAVNRAINTAFNDFDGALAATDEHDDEREWIGLDLVVLHAAVNNITRKFNALLAKEVAKLLISEQRRQRREMKRKRLDEHSEE